MSVIDVHNHYYPPAYLKALERGPSNVRITFDTEGNPMLHYPGDYNVVVRGHRDIAYRSQVLADHGISHQVLTLTTPGTHVEPPERAVYLARLVNDGFAEAIRDYPERFSGLATLPLNDPVSSARELERTANEMGFKGAMLFSNVNGRPLADEEFWRIYEVADALHAVLHIHPTSPVGVEAMTDYGLMPLVGFLFDTTLAAAKLVFSGVVERFRGIRWVLSHLGGAIPYLAERLDRGFHAFVECREHIDKPPSEYLKTMYYDTVNFDARALQLAIEFAGTDHLLAGSDYPHLIGSLTSMLSSIQSLPIAEKDKAAILGGNVGRLLQINV